MDFVRLDLSERMANLEEDLPPGTSRVTVAPYVPREFAQQERQFMLYTFTGPQTDEALRKHVEDEFVPDLSCIECVAVVQAYG